jgi:lipopolysaccharide biosynthesis regulator YciM
MPGHTEAVNAAWEGPAKAIAAQASDYDAMAHQLAAAVERMNEMQADCAEAIEQCCTLAENRIAADRQAAEQRGQLIERTLVLGLIGLVLNGLEEGDAAASLRSLRRMVEEAPIEIGSPASELVS